MASLMSIFLALIILIPISALSMPTGKDSLRQAIKTQDWSEALNQLKSLQESSEASSNKDLYILAQAFALLGQGKQKESIALLEPIKDTSLYYVWAKVLLARSAYQSRNVALLQSSLKALEKVPLKGDIKIEKNFYEAHLLIESKS